MVLTQLRTCLFGIFGLTVLKLNVIVGGAAPSARICALADRLAIEHRLRLVHVDLCYATTATTAV